MAAGHRLVGGSKKNQQLSYASQGDFILSKVLLPPEDGSSDLDGNNSDDPEDKLFNHHANDFYNSDSSDAPSLPPELQDILHELEVGEDLHILSTENIGTYIEDQGVQPNVEAVEVVNQDENYVFIDNVIPEATCIADNSSANPVTFSSSTKKSEEQSTSNLRKRKKKKLPSVKVKKQKTCNIKTNKTPKRFSWVKREFDHRNLSLEVDVDCVLEVKRQFHASSAMCDFV
ncbi:uncharacterized protein LOC120349621 [Nilaparvata lugens]|uniref:uncharacterized protein LOC120349621 n=1 Tax=Nilaparvata lugens TaxID=108931 RepID=UPI00193E817A|nr:uncharacterized protein LOC120349621 [Nilaparvata lugens]